MVEREPSIDHSWVLVITKNEGTHYGDSHTFDQGSGVRGGKSARGVRD